MDTLRGRLERVRGGLYGTRLKENSRSEATDKALAGPVPSIREQLKMLDRIATLQGAGDTNSGSCAPELDDVLGGHSVETPCGCAYEILSAYSPSFRHGYYRLEQFLNVDMEHMHAFCGGGALKGILPEQVLFLDVEATGISMGTGTYILLVGLGFFRGGRYRLHQLFMRNFLEENSFLQRAAEIMEPFRVIVSFNGKRFDLPLLETRLMLCGGPAALHGKIIWDVLYPARRLWKGRLGDCRLETIENTRLGVVREGRDVRSEDIPGIYYRYVHTGEMFGLDRIVYHNAMDVLSLTSLLTVMDRSLRDKDPCLVNLLSTGRFYERSGMSDIGLECYEIASGTPVSSQEQETALFRLARRKKRDGRIGEAIRLWQQVLSGDGLLVLDSCIELAKCFEHQTREIDKAIAMTELALSTHPMLSASVECSLRKRIERLRRKQSS